MSWRSRQGCQHVADEVRLPEQGPALPGRCRRRPLAGQAVALGVVHQGKDAVGQHAGVGHLKAAACLDEQLRRIAEILHVRTETDRPAPARGLDEAEPAAAKGSFRFAPVMYLQQALEHISAMPQQNFDQIVEKYVEMNVAHPFREGNGRATRIWLDLMLKKEIQQVIDWNAVDKADYLSAMERSVVKDIEIKHLLKNAWTEKINDRELYMKGIDVSYYYEGYSEYRVEDL